MSSSDLEQQETPESKSNGLSRREVMKRGLVIGGATYVVPAVVSMVSPLSAFAATPTPTARPAGTAGTAGAALNLVPCTVVLQRFASAPVLVGVTGTAIGVIQSLSPSQSQSQSQSQSANATANANSTIAVQVTITGSGVTSSTTRSTTSMSALSHEPELFLRVFGLNGIEILGLSSLFRRGADGSIIIDVQGTADASASATTVQVQTQRETQIGGVLVPAGVILFQTAVVPCIISPLVVLPIGTVTQTVTQRVTQTQTGVLPDCRVTLVPNATIPNLVVTSGTVLASVGNQTQTQSQSQSATARATANSNFNATITITGLGRERFGRGITNLSLFNCLSTLTAEQVAAFIALRTAVGANVLANLNSGNLFALLSLGLTANQIAAILGINGALTAGNLGNLGTLALTTAQINAILALGTVNGTTLGAIGVPGFPTLTADQIAAILRLQARGTVSATTLANLTLPGAGALTEAQITAVLAADLRPGNGNDGRNILELLELGLTNTQTRDVLDLFAALQGNATLTATGLRAIGGTVTVTGLTPAQITAVLGIGGTLTAGNLGALGVSTVTPLTAAQIALILALGTRDATTLAGIGVRPLTSVQISALLGLNLAVVRAILGLSAANRTTLATLTLRQVDCLLELTVEQLTSLGRLTTTQLGQLDDFRPAQLRATVTGAGEFSSVSTLDPAGNIVINVTGSANASANAVAVEVQTEQQQQGANAILPVLGVVPGTVLFTAVVNTPCTLR